MPCIFEASQPWTEGLRFSYNRGNQRQSADRFLQLYADVRSTVCWTEHQFRNSMDRETAAASGLPVLWLDVMLYVTVAVAVVVSVQIIGNVLVLALLVGPAATARLLTDKLTVMMLLSPILGCVASVLGMYFSWSLDLATGGTIVLVITGLFVMAWMFSPKHGAVKNLVQRVRQG